MATEKKTRKKSAEKNPQEFTWKEYKDPMEAKAAMDAYFDQCEETGELCGEAGLALHIGISLKTLRSWKHGEVPGFLSVADYAYMRIAADLDKNPAYRQKAMVARACFLAKQPDIMGYRDRTEENKSIDVNFRIDNKSVEMSDFD